MEKSTYIFLSQDGKTPIHAVEWLPEGSPRAVLQLSHGVAEYIERYEPFAAFLCRNGFAAVGSDHIGHGRSRAPGAPRLYFGPVGSWQTVVDDMESLRSRTRARYPGVPYFLLGHSMGSFLARTYLIRYPGSVDGAILMGTGQMSPAKVAAGRLIAAGETRRLGETKVSPVVSALAFDAYNKRFAPNRTAFDWLSVNRENVDAYVADPLCGGSATIGLFREMLSGLEFIRQPVNLRRMNLHTPVLFVSGSKDPVGDFGKGVRQAYESFRRAGAEDVSLRLYEGFRHEILNDDCRETVYRELLTWMEARMARAATTERIPVEK